VTRDNHIDGAVIVTVDVDAVKRAALARAEAQTEHEFRGLLTAAPEAILVIDVAGRLAFANAKAQEMFGYDANEMNGIRVIETLAPERLHEIYHRLLSDYLANARVRAEGREPEFCGRRKDGTEFPIEFVVGSIVREGGPIVVAFVTDVTNRRETEGKLRESQERLHQMAFDTAVAESRQRRRIAINLHDHLGQTLVLAQMKLASLREAIPDDARASFDEAIELLGRSLADTRTLMFELSPPILYDLGLKAALAWLADELEQRHGLLVELTDDQADKPLDDSAAALVFRAVRELLLNVYKHAKADAAKVSLRRTGDCIAIDVEDRGVGFHPGSIDGPSPSGGFGLLSVRDQISRLGGSVEITSAPRRGTRVRLHVPLKILERLEVRTPS